MTDKSLRSPVRKAAVAKDAQSLPMDLVLQQSFLGLVLVIVGLYSYAYLFQVPYAGFDFSGEKVTAVSSSAGAAQGIKIDDRLIAVGDVTWHDFTSDLDSTLFNQVDAGDVIPLRIMRNNEAITIPWVLPGFNRADFLDRLLSPWMLPYVFWGLGLVAYLHVRPRDRRWQLLVAFNLLTAIWLAAGSGPSKWHIWKSALVLRAGVWLCVPVYWHLHWLFPRPLAKIPAPIVVAVYLTAIGLAFADWLQYLPSEAYVIGFALAVIGSLLLLTAHAVFQPDQRQVLSLLIRLATIIVVPLVGALLLSLLWQNTAPASLILLSLPLIPGAYLYTIYRHRLGRLEVRANRLITLYLYFILLGFGLLLLVVLLINVFDVSPTLVPFGLTVAVLVSLVTLTTYRPFERFFARYIFRISIRSRSLLQAQVTHIATRLDKKDLANWFEEQLLPSLMVRQSVLVYFRQNQQQIDRDELGELNELSVFFALNAECVPSVEEFDLLLTEANVYRPPNTLDDNCVRCSWVRLIVPLYLNQVPIGLWLLGQRDPDDMYHNTEIPILQALAAQTAIALTNIMQAEDLRALYQANINRQERERNHLARELHDQILNQIGLLVMYIEEDRITPRFNEVYDELTSRLRATIHDLRPVTLSYGLCVAVNDLADELADRSRYVAVCCELPHDATRYTQQVEEHLFRIVQQATENALKHASATTIRIFGQLTATEVCLHIADDGVGFQVDKPLDLTAVLRRRHFGLAGMFERAAIIGAQLKIDSAIGQGTTVTVSWQAEDQPSLQP